MSEVFLRVSEIEHQNFTYANLYNINDRNHCNYVVRHFTRKGKTRNLLRTRFSGIRVVTLWLLISGLQKSCGAKRMDLIEDKNNALSWSKSTAAQK